MSYLAFKNVGNSPSGKTCIWEVISTQRQDVLGEIKWFGRWHQYTFFPICDTIWNDDCLIEISAFLTKVTAEHRMLSKVSH